MSDLGRNDPCMNWDAQDLDSAWKRFIQHVNFMFMGPLTKKTEAERCAYLMLWVGEKGRTIYQTWNLTPEESKVLKNYNDKFEAYVKPRSNQVFNRYKFHSKIQGEESFDQFVTDLKILVKDCGYDKPQEMVRDRIVIGVKSSKIREKLLSEGSDLTLDKTEDIAKSYEAAKAQTQSMASKEDPQVNAVFTRSQNTKSRLSNQSTHNKSARKSVDKDSFCTRCGYKGHTGLEKEKCPAIGRKCSKCKLNDHFAAQCKTKTYKRGSINPKKVHVIDDYSSSEQSSDGEDSLYVGMIIELSNVEYDRKSLSQDWIIHAEVEGKPVTMQLDTGAKCNVMSISTYKDLKLDATALEKSSAKLKTYSGHILKTVGVATVPVEINEKTNFVKFQIVDLNAETILGADTCKTLNIVQRVYTVENSTANKPPKDIRDKYPEIFKGLGCLPGKHHIQIDETMEPVVHPPRKVPIALQQKVKEELTRMENMKVIIKQEKPTKYVNSMVTVVKPNGKLRICVDPKDLNKAIMREHHPMKSIEDLTPKMVNARVFTKLDATSGFWQCKLDKESQELCTFNTPYGRYSFTRLPYGIKSAPEVYQKLISKMLNGLDGCEAIIDDILIWGENMKQHDERLDAVLKRITENNLKLNCEKCEFRKSQVKYMGHVLSADGVKPDFEKIRAVLEMPTPGNMKELQSFLGFVTYLGKFLGNLSQVSAPLRKLLEKNVIWHWEKEQQESFEKLKKMITEAPVLAYFDQKKPIVLTCDASKSGLGTAIKQDEKVIAYASRALTKSQQNYAQIEKECLAIAFGCSKFHTYLYGRPILVESDHKPLQAIFRKPLYQAPPRLQRILLTLQKYDLNVQYKPGKEMYISDFLSRAYLNETIEDLNSEELSINSLLCYLPISEEKMKLFQKETATDSELNELIKHVQNGWPVSKEHVSQRMIPYWNFRDEITMIDGLLFKSHKLVVPETLRASMLELIHEAHTGIQKCQSRAREALFWIGMSKDIEVKVAKCELCNLSQKCNQKEPLVKTEIPDRPWSKISADLFSFKGNHYLLTIDRYSLWPEIAKLDDLSSENTIMYLKSQFSRYGIPDELYSDNGPQFSSHSFDKFKQSYGFCHVTSSPHFPQSNGFAERGVQTVKNLLKKAQDPYKAMLIYRDTNIESIGLSPAKMFLGRRLKTTLPVTTPLLKPMHADKKVKERKLKQQEMQKHYHDRHAGKELSDLKTGENVLIQTYDKKQNKWEPGTIVNSRKNRSYTVENSRGENVRRNRKHLKPTRAEFNRDTFDDNFEFPATTQKEMQPDPQPSSIKQTTQSGRTVKMPSKYDDFIT